MKILIDYDIEQLLHTAISSVLKENGLQFRINSSCEIVLNTAISPEEYEHIKKVLAGIGISILVDSKYILVEKIKYYISQYFSDTSIDRKVKLSVFLADKCHYSYGHLSAVFAEVTYTSIENFTIIRKIGQVKLLLRSKKHTLTEIAYQLKYSSVAHLSNQFKATTGISPSMYCHIIDRKKQLAHTNPSNSKFEI